MSTNYPSISEGKGIRGLLAVIPSLINHLPKVSSNKNIFLATLTQKRINCHQTFHLGEGGGGVYRQIYSWKSSCKSMLLPHAKT